MKEYTVGERTYRLAGGLTEYQLGMYVHLVDWKRAHLTEECGYYKYKGRLIPYDSMLPAGIKAERHPLYRPIVSRVLEHQKRFPFKLHKFVGHMASSQVACINLFVPLLQYPELAAQILRTIKPDLASIATDHLDKGFRIEYWQGHDNERGPLNDHSARAGTDADIAIAYRDHGGRLKLWLIEHKLTEKEFTPCGGATSNGRTVKHRCEPVADILANHDLCYYHESDRCRYTYWPITDRHPQVFPPERLAAQAECPFKGGMNQLWRNMLLALSVEDDPDQPYDAVHFSVVRHPDNYALEPTIRAFTEVTAGTHRFRWFTSDRIVHGAAETDSPDLQDWARWYSGLYRIGSHG